MARLPGSSLGDGRLRAAERARASNLLADYSSSPKRLATKCVMDSIDNIQAATFHVVIWTDTDCFELLLWPYNML